MHSRPETLTPARVTCKDVRKDAKSVEALRTASRPDGLTENLHLNPGMLWV